MKDAIELLTKKVYELKKDIKDNQNSLAELTSSVSAAKVTIRKLTDEKNEINEAIELLKKKEDNNGH